MCSDHYCVLCSIALEKTHSKKREIICRKGKYINVDNIKQDMNSALTSLQEFKIVDNAVDEYNRVLTESIDKCAPPKKITVVTRPKSKCFNDEIRQAKQKCRRQ